MVLRLPRIAVALPVALDALEGESSPERDGGRS
jgi:hypothetical protein